MWAVRQNGFGKGNRDWGWDGVLEPPYFSSWLLWLPGCPFIRRWAERLKLHLRLGYGLRSIQSVLNRLCAWRPGLGQKHMIEVAYLAPRGNKTDMRDCTGNCILIPIPQISLFM